MMELSEKFRTFFLERLILPEKGFKIKNIGKSICRVIRYVSSWQSFLKTMKKE
jgi:hypothetical protein